MAHPAKAAQVAGTMRERNRARAQRELQTAAMRLFRTQGYAATTVAQIAEAGGVSPRTFFRYFRSKEDLVVDAPVGYGAVLAAELRTRPFGENPWAALVATLRTRTAYWQARPELAREVTDLLAESSALRTSMHGKTRQWHDELAAALRERLDGPTDTRDLRANAITGTVIACLDAAFTAWQHNPTQDLDTLFDNALAAVHPHATA